GRALSDWRNNFIKLNAVRGWILDVYPSGPNEVTVWVIAENGERFKFVDRFVRRIYVSANYSDLKALADKVKDSKSVAGLRFVEKYADFMEAEKKKVLEIDMRDYGRISFFARKILRLGGYERYRLFNVDMPVAQAYLYEKDIFPLAHVLVIDSGNRVSYELLDSVDSCEYAIPPLRSVWLNVSVKKEEVSARFSDKIESMSLDANNKTIVISEGSETDKILALVKAVQEEDPDIIFTQGGDSFLFPYLAYRAFVNGVLDRFVLSREDIPLKAKKGQGRSFFSYGRVYYKAPVRRLYGRVHIDVDNTFIFTACGLDGLIEVSRTCRVPLHRAARASIGSIMSSLQLYTAWKSDILVPWKKGEPESFKSGWELLVADRGGFVFEPKLGFHTDVVEVDFTSMFPMLMLTRNISAETVLCKCCPDSKLRVPELGYNICEKRRGIVPKTLDLLLKKRLRYKGLLREVRNEGLKKAYDLRQAALKWILVTCFGYLGYRNAKFGRVDAHIAVCAFARDALLKTARLAEDHGFEVVHGIVDSLWIKKPGVTPREVADFCHEASKIVDVPLGVEGKYRWIVFLPSKLSPEVPVLNRYYGVFEDGRIKMRGIEARRGDTPAFIENAQIEMIKVLRGASNYNDFVHKIPEALYVLKSYAQRLLSGNVDVYDLVVAKRLSRHPNDYAHDVFQAIAGGQLLDSGFDVYPGQTVRYIIVDADNRSPNNRVRAVQLFNGRQKFDVQKYLEMLLEAGETLFEVFGYDLNRIRNEVIYGETQAMLG
ncbi:MAG: DNA polymerase domain-containing protein, partial [Candidatus Bathyarchaeia archaeon]